MNALKRVRELAEDGYCCTQVLAIMGMELSGDDDPAYVRAAGGLCGGIGGSGGVCGCLTGGALMLARHIGNDSESPKTSPEGRALIKELAGWFEKELCANCGSINCSEMKKYIDAGNMSTCQELMAETYIKAVELLESRDLI